MQETTLSSNSEPLDDALMLKGLDDDYYETELDAPSVSRAIYLGKYLWIEYMLRQDFSKETLNRVLESFIFNLYKMGQYDGITISDKEHISRIIDKLIEKGANPDGRISAGSYLFMSCYMDLPRAVELFLRKGTYSPAEKNGALAEAIRSSCSSIPHLLLHGATITIELVVKFASPAALKYFISENIYTMEALQREREAMETSGDLYDYQLKSLQERFEEISIATLGTPSSAQGPSPSLKRKDGKSDGSYSNAGFGYGQDPVDPLAEFPSDVPEPAAPSAESHLVKRAKIDLSEPDSGLRLQVETALPTVSKEASSSAPGSPLGSAAFRFAGEGATAVGTNSLADQPESDSASAYSY